VLLRTRRRWGPAYRVDDGTGQESDCLLPADMLGFEMLRVEHAVELEQIERPAGLPMVRATSCG